jgi:phytoene desaturase
MAYFPGARPSNTNLIVGDAAALRSPVPHEAGSSSEVQTAARMTVPLGTIPDTVTATEPAFATADQNTNGPARRLGRNFERMRMIQTSVSIVTTMVFGKNSSGPVNVGWRLVWGSMIREAVGRSAAIIGAGPGGLAAAMMLAATGAKVTVFEKDPWVGGRTKTISVDEFPFDLGPTFFLYPQILEQVFERCGLRIQDYVELRRVEPGYRLIFEGGPEVRVSGQLDNLESEIAKLNREDAKRIRAFIEKNRRKLADFKPVLERPFLSLLDYLAPSVLSALRHIVPMTSVDEELKRYFRDPRVRLAFSFQTKYLGMSPFRCPNLFTFLSFLEFEFGIWHPVGGCGAVSEGMARAARDLGVELRLADPVRSIEFEGKRAVSVVSASGRYQTDACVINADFAQAVTTLIPAPLRRKWSDRRIESMKYSCSTFMLYLGIDGGYDIDHHNIFLSDRYEENIAEIEAADVVPTRPSIYVANPSRTDPKFAPNGNSSLYVLAPVGHCGKVDWQKEGGPFRELVLQRLEAFGLTDLRSRIRSERMLTPEDWRNQLSIFRGATFNLAHGLDQMLYFRPHNKLEDVEGVYLVGGGTHPGSGLPVIYEGARITSDLVLSRWKRSRTAGRAELASAQTAVTTSREVSS